jgi:hypothetical protein
MPTEKDYLIEVMLGEGRFPYVKTSPVYRDFRKSLNTLPLKTVTRIYDYLYSSKKKK